MLEQTNSNLDNKRKIQLAIRRAQFIKKLKIKVKPSEKTYDQDQLILIETYNTQKKSSVQLVMRKLSQLDSLIEYMNNEYGGHIIPTFSYQLYYQNSLEMDKIIPAIQQYLQDLKNNKYCRQDLKFYCFLIEQHSYTPKQMGFQRVFNNATDHTRRYLNDIFARNFIPQDRTAYGLVNAKQHLQIKIEQYYEVKCIAVIKAQQTIIFEELTSLLSQMSAWPCLALQPQEQEIDFIWKSIKSCEKLIQQAKRAFIRWQKLADKVVELQNNIYKGLYQYEKHLNEKSQQLKQWSESLTIEFEDLQYYLSQKMQRLAAQVYKINLKFIDMTMFAGQGFESLKQDELAKLGLEQKLAKQSTNQKDNQIYEGQGNKQNKFNKKKAHVFQIQLPTLKSSYSNQISQQIKINPSEPPSQVRKYLSDLSQDLLKQQNSQLTNEFNDNLKFPQQNLQATIENTQQQIICDD